MKSRHAGAMFMLLVLAALAAGCGGKHAAVSNPIATAAAKTVNAGGVKMSVEVLMKSRGFPSGSASLDANGAFDGANGSLAMDMTPLLRLAGAPATINGHISELLLEQNGDPVLYLHLPFLAGHLPAGKEWVRLDLKNSAKDLGQEFNQLWAQANQSPADTFDLLNTSTGVTKVGAEKIAGAETTHYKGTIDLGKATSKAASDRLKGLGAPTTIPFDAWVGSDGRVHQFAMTYATTLNGIPATMTMTMQLSDFGAHVSVTAPPASSIVDTGGTTK